MGKRLIEKPIKEQWRDICEDDIQAVERYLRTQPISIIDGGVMKEFEQAFAEFAGAKYAVAYCNGTAALHAATFAIGACQQNQILISEYCYHGTVNAALENRTNVVLCDYDENTLNIDCIAAEKSISSSTIGLLITHCWGNPVNMDKLKELKEKYGVRIISDASHAHGAEWRGKRIGGLDVEDIVCFSLGRNKLISVGELGVAVTNDITLYDRLLFMGHPNRVPYAFLTDELKKYPNGIGNKYRPHPISMVLALMQLKRYKAKMDFNIFTNDTLVKRISEIPGFKAIDVYEGARRVYWKLLFRLDHSFWGDIEDDVVIRALLETGLPLQQFHNYRIQDHEKIWKHDRYNGQVINLSHIDTPKDIVVMPGYVSISKEDMNHIVNAFEIVANEKWRLK